MQWFKKTSYPDFWTAYNLLFKQKQEQALSKIRFVVFDTETTGLNPSTDRILSIGCIAIKDLKIQVSDQFEIYLMQDSFNTDTVKIHGLLKAGKEQKISEEEAMKAFLAYIEDAVIVAHHAAFDIAMINRCLRRLNLPKLKNKVLDTGHIYLKLHNDLTETHFSLDRLSDHYNIPQHDRHTASGDAFITALLFTKLVKEFIKRNPARLNALAKSHRRIGLL